MWVLFVGLVIIINAGHARHAGKSRLNYQSLRSIYEVEVIGDNNYLGI
jgi:hypothetical protein